MSWFKFVVIKVIVATCFTCLIYVGVRSADLRMVAIPRAILWGRHTCLGLHGRYLRVGWIDNIPPEAPYFDVVRFPLNKYAPYLNCQERMSKLKWVDLLPYVGKPAFVLGLLLPPWRRRRRSKTDARFEVQPKSDVACDQKH
jgi:hypothetical protein